jgi:hypothetical protein
VNSALKKDATFRRARRSYHTIMDRCLPKSGIASVASLREPRLQHPGHLVDVSFLQHRNSRGNPAGTRRIIEMLSSRTSNLRLAVTSASLAVAMTGMAAVSGAEAGEAEAKSLLKTMSDYMGSQQSISFAFDSTLEVVTKDQQKLQLASSGTVELNRPDKIHATRHGGFADVAMTFDGKTLTVVGKGVNIYAQTEIPGTVENLVDELRDKYQRPLPAADLLLPNTYDVLMEDVTDIKDLGSGIVGGQECDHLAFRAKDVDWQIWIAQGDKPYPCRYVISTKTVDLSPQYSIQLRDWNTAGNAAASFEFKNETGATKVEFAKLGEADLDELPNHFSTGGAQ